MEDLERLCLEQQKEDKRVNVLSKQFKPIHYCLIMKQVLTTYFSSLSCLLPGTNQYWCHMNHGHNPCDVQTHNSQGTHLYN